MSFKHTLINIPQHLKQLNSSATSEYRSGSVSSFLNNQSGQNKLFNKFDYLRENLVQNQQSLRYTYNNLYDVRMNKQISFVTEYLEQVVFKNIRKISQNNFRIEDYLFQIQRIQQQKDIKKNQHADQSK
ncbi:Hypothetical_protein [Hexamita inflata]|uniref:Hypothetical_protein n=1 Tax=Hexamita inflata TaxID=28002 RepID=A0AA86TGX0_9EUKA|nr:Hypothetical protein HINF_LOCUS5864 [Hexamita inflata]